MTRHAIRLPWSEETGSEFAQSARKIEWLSLLRWMLDSPEVASANSTEAARLVPWLEQNGQLALGLLKLLKNVHSRDQLIKLVVLETYGLAEKERGGIANEALVGLSNELERIDTLLSNEYQDVLEESRELLRAQVSSLVDGLDPAGDIASITREPCSLSIAVAPCLFLPPPQVGRHGVFLPLAEQPVLQLYFGFPLHEDPQRYGIDSQFLSSGAWHYGLSSFLRSSWPAVEEKLRPMTAVADVFEGSLRSDRKRPWPAAVEEHLKIVLRSQLAERSGGRRRHFEILSEAFALPHFSWFAQWMDEGLSSKQSLRDQLTDLPQDLAEAVSSGALFRRPCRVPDAINLTIISQSSNGLHIVVPDAWDDSLLTAVRKNWRALAAPVVRQSVWRAQVGSATTPAIALGNPDNNPLVATVLERRAMQLPPDDEILLALLPPGEAQEPWCIAVAARQAEVAADVTLEIAVRLTCSYAVMRKERVIAADGVTGGL